MITNGRSAGTIPPDDRTATVGFSGTTIGTGPNLLEQRGGPRLSGYSTIAVPMVVTADALPAFVPSLRAGLALTMFLGSIRSVR